MEWTPTGLWLALVASGLYHGVNPGMGWPLAVSAGLMERSSPALIAALWPLALGHLLAMLVVILPFALLIAVVEWQQQIKSAPVSWSSVSASSCWSTGAIRGRWIEEAGEWSQRPGHIVWIGLLEPSKCDVRDSLSYDCD